MRLTRRLCALILTIALGACGDNGAGPVIPPPPPPLQVTSLSPAPDAADAETGATVTIVLNQAIDLATLTTETFVVRLGADELVTSLSYDAAARTARAAAPFLPGTLYNAEVTTGLRTPADSALGQSETWEFTTHPWQRLTADFNGSVGWYSSLAVDATDRVHVSYFDATNDNLKYATCASDCTAFANWGRVAVDAAGTVGLHTALAVDAGGRIHVSYLAERFDEFDPTFPEYDLKYATCAADCQSAAANWTTVTVRAVGDFVSAPTSLAVDASGRVHVTYLDVYQGVSYASCGAACDQTANWTTVVLDPDVFNLGNSLAVDASGRLHLSYQDQVSQDLRYATCAGGCEAAARWHAVTLDAVGDVGDFNSLGVDGNGRVHISYWDVSNWDLKYASCSADCQVAASWQLVTVDAEGDVGRYTALAVDGSGRVHVSYLDETSDAVKYATCAAGCEAATSWQAAAVDPFGGMPTLISSTSLAVDAGGSVHISYFDGINADLEYLQ